MKQWSIKNIVSQVHTDPNINSPLQMEPPIGRELDCLGVSLKVVMHVRPRLVKVRVSVGVYDVLFSSLISFLTLFVPLFDVQIV